MKFGIIGLGEISKKHKEAIKAIGGELVAECDTDISRLDKNVPFVTTNYRELVLMPEVETVDIQRLLRHPLVDRVAVVYQRRHNIQCLYIKNIDKKPIFVNVRMLVKRDNSYWNTWRKIREKSGGGSLMNITIHYLDLLIWWFGDNYKINYANTFVDQGVDKALVADIAINNIPIIITSSAFHYKKDIEIAIRYEDGSNFVYDIDDATHTDIYRNFLEGKKVSVIEAAKSLKLVEDLYAKSSILN